jgi:hypothetical protein
MDRFQTRCTLITPPLHTSIKLRWIYTWKTYFAHKRRTTVRTYSWYQVSNVAATGHRLISWNGLWLSCGMLHAIPTARAASYHNLTYPACLLQPQVWWKDFRCGYPSREEIVWKLSYEIRNTRMVSLRFSAWVRFSTELPVQPQAWWEILCSMTSEVTKVQ